MAIGYIAPFISTDSSGSEIPKEDMAGKCISATGLKRGNHVGRCDWELTDSGPIKGTLSCLPRSNAWKSLDLHLEKDLGWEPLIFKWLSSTDP